MNISNVNSEMKFVNRIGQALSVEERIGLEVNVLKLSCEYTYEQFNFWGRVEGISRNYYIVEGVNYKGETNFPSKKFFWSNEQFKFAELPQPRSEYTQQVKKMNDYFTGQHQKILIKSNQQVSKVVEHNGVPMQIRQKNLTQLDRLSIVVRLIQHNCQIIPLGALRMIPTHQLVKNPEFRGLKIDQCKDLRNYVHLRAPVIQDKKILIECDKALERADFMDAISDDVVKKSWSIQTDQSGTQITIRSILWQGYVGYHRTNSVIYGGVYMGNGICSHDLEFLL